MLSGCPSSSHCGTYHRAVADCDPGLSDKCTTDCANEDDPTDCTVDRTTCDGAPVYQKDGNSRSYVLYRAAYYEDSRWYIGPPDVLDDCDPVYRHRLLQSVSRQYTAVFLPFGRWSEVAEMVGRAAPSGLP